MLIIPERYRVRNEFWAEVTPNEFFSFNLEYQTATRMWCGAWNVDVDPSRFREVRVTSNKPTHEMSRNWWDQPGIMDQIFWVFTKPKYYFDDDKKPYGMYYLEPLECARVIEMARKKLGYNPFPDDQVPLLIPVECVTPTIRETKAGELEHVRPREEVKVSAEAEDKELATREYVNQKLKEVVDVSSDPVFNQPVTSGSI
jgi:hypothetical protein